VVWKLRQLLLAMDLLLMTSRTMDLLLTRSRTMKMPLLMLRPWLGSDRTASVAVGTHLRAKYSD
jgi:hypothetical protein